jgi:AcrR family transcriptional regulator
LISRVGAAEAALEIIDDLGLEALSLPLVAKKLGVRSPSLYHHFASKSELLQEVARIMLIRLPRMRNTKASFEERIITLCLSTRRVLLKHPNASPLILQYFPKHLLLAAYNRTATQSPYPSFVLFAVIEALEKCTYGSALFEASARTRGLKSMPPVDPDKFPDLAKIVDDNPFNDEEVFVETLRFIFAGVRERLRTGTVGEPLE